jgi:Glyoxalase-like domain
MNAQLCGRLAVRIDHVVIGVGDLNDAARRLSRVFGLTSVVGGRHRGWGTTNQLVPLGDSYLELVTVVDPVEAATAPFGRWAAEMSATGSGWGWAVRTDAIHVIADRLGLAVVEGSRPAPDGRLLTWHVAGIEQARQNPSLPFFIQWGRDTPLPGQTAVAHRSGTWVLSTLVVAGDDHLVHDWLGERLPSVSVVPGVAGIVSIELISTSGVIRVEPTQLMQ